MFSFIKWFSNLIQKARRNKGLWFTILTTFALIGIFVSLFFVNFLVNDVAKKTYENQKVNYSLELKSILELQNRVVLSAATSIAQNSNIHLLFKSDDLNKTAKLKAIADIYANNLNKNLNSKYFKVHFTYDSKTVDTKKLNGVFIKQDGAYIGAKLPLSTHNGVRLSVEVDEKLNSLYELLKKEKKDIAFLLNSGAMSHIDPKIKKDQYIQIYDKYYVNHKVFDEEFIANMKNADFKQFERDGYIKNMNYFFVYEKLYDHNGQDLGVMVIGKKIVEKNSFVNLIKNLVNSVTIVAIGLIISMILFLF